MMPKFRLITRDRYGNPAPYVLLSLRGKGLHAYRYVEALIDTGAPWTSILPAGSLILQIPKRLLKRPSDVTTARVGAHSFHRYVLENVRVILSGPGERGAHWSIVANVPHVSVLEPVGGSREAHPMRDLPAVVGCDIISSLELSLSFESRDFFLEVKESAPCRIIAAGTS